MAIFKKGKEFIGKKVGMAGDQLSGEDMAAELSKALGQPVTYNKIQPQCLEVLVFPEPMIWVICSSSMMSLKKK